MKKYVCKIKRDVTFVNGTFVNGPILLYKKTIHAKNSMDAEEGIWNSYKKGLGRFCQARQTYIIESMVEQ